MDDQRVGRIVRALRRRLGWRQLDLAAKAGCSQGLVSLVERGHLDRISLMVLRRILAAVDARASIEVTWRGGELSRLLDEDHAHLAGRVAEYLRAAAWLVESEITYSQFGERGSYDLIAFHPPSGTLLAVEVKTDFVSAEATLRKLDEKSRLARTVVRERFGWQVRAVGRMLIMPDDRTLRRRIQAVRSLIDTAYPDRAIRVRQWIAAPSGTMSGIWFLPNTNGSSAGRKPGGRSRVRRPGKVTDTNRASAA